MRVVQPVRARWSRSRTIVTIAALAAATLLGTVPSSPAQARGSVPSITGRPAVAHGKVVRLCPAHPRPGHATCYAEQVLPKPDSADASGDSSMGITPATSTPYGYGPSDLQSAYNLPASGGTGETVYVVDAYDNPHAESDLASYRSHYGLPACTTANGCFRKLNQSGATSPLPAANSGWAGEIDLDVQMVSAVCPSCHITLIEASNSGSGLYAGVAEAVAMGAKFVSMSWGGPEFSSEAADDSYFNHPGVLFAASTGDKAYAGKPSYPAMSPDVLAVGGTHLVRSSTTRGWTETVWGSGSQGAGSGCSAYEAKPARESFIAGTLCGKRAGADISAEADPNTGVAIVSNGAWALMGGTSASAPMITAMYALNGDPAAGSAPQTYPYTNSSQLTDVTSGSTGSCGTLICNAAAGWDGPTGLGTPWGIGALSGPGSDTPSISYLGGSIAAATATAGLPSSVSASVALPTGRTLKSIAWKSARSDCSFANPAAVSTTVTCNATDTGTVALTATVVASSGATATLSGKLAFAGIPSTKRPVSIQLGVDHQTSGVKVCTGDAAPVVGTVVDTATGSPVKGLTVTFSRKMGTATTYTSLGTAATGGTGVATKSVASTSNGTFKASTATQGAFLAAGVQPTMGFTVGTCAPQLQATANSTTAWYGDKVTVSGSVVRDAPDGSGSTLPVGGVSVPVVLQAPSTTVNGKTTTPAPVVLGTLVSGTSGTFSGTFTATKTGELGARINASAGLSATSVDIGALTVSTPTSALTGALSATTEQYGDKVTLSGKLTKTAAATTGMGNTAISIRLLKSGATTPTTLTTLKTAADGSFKASLGLTASGTVSVAYAGATGVTGTTATAGAVSVLSWKTALTGAASTAQVTYGGKVTVTGKLSKTSLSTANMANTAVVMKLMKTGSTTLTPLGTAITHSDGSYSYSFAPSASGELYATYGGAPWISSASVDVGPVTVLPWTPSLTVAASTATVAKAGTAITVSGTVHRTASGVTQAAAVAVRIVLTPASGSPITLATTTSSSTGAFKVAVTPRISGTITAQVASVVGYVNGSSAGVPVTIGSARTVAA